VPFWAKDPKIGYKLINARAETVAEKPSFKYAYRARRCLVPASGYFEWQQRASGKQPYYFTRRDDSLLAFAGLWECWKHERGADGLLSYTVIVCEPNTLSADIHDRMPVMIEAEYWHDWLAADDPSALLKPYPSELLKRYAVSTLVNRPGNEGPQVIEPISEPG
jgi:putative SOS response-associated peptidase YedK